MPAWSLGGVSLVLAFQQVAPTLPAGLSGWIQQTFVAALDSMGLAHCPLCVGLAVLSLLRCSALALMLLRLCASQAQPRLRLAAS